MSSPNLIVQVPLPSRVITKNHTQANGLSINTFENMYNAFDYARKHKLKMSDFISPVYTKNYVSPTYDFSLPIKFASTNVFHHIEIARITHLINYAYSRFPAFTLDVDLAIDFSDARQFILVSNGLHDESFDGVRTTHFSIKFCGDPKQVKQFHIYPNCKNYTSDYTDPYIYSITRLLQYCA